MQRQLIHVFLGLFIIDIILFLPFHKWILGSAFILFLVCSILEKRSLKVPVFHQFITFFEREKEQQGIRAEGFLSFLAGSLLATMIFSQTIALASIAILTFGDSTAHLFWRRGRIRNPLNKDKYLEEAIGGGVIAGIAASVFLPIIVAFIVSVLTMMLESVDITIKGKKIEDNLTIPVIAGILASIGMMLL